MEQQYYKQKKILLVDDEKALLDMVADFLRENGYTQIKTAGTVAAAIDAGQKYGSRISRSSTSCCADGGRLFAV